MNLCRVRVRVARGVASVLVAWSMLITSASADSRTAEQKALFEEQRVARTLDAHGLQPEPAPQGKRIAFVRIVREEVFVEQELLIPIVLPRVAPTWPNALHWTTEESVVRAELLFHEGDVYDEARIEETMRNLRSLSILSLARIVTVRAERPDEVGVLVFTRDIWSLRLETGFSGAGSTFAFTAQLVERNLFGENRQLTLRLDRDPKAFSVGEVYAERRFLGERLALGESFDVIFNQERGEPEGSQGLVSLGQPFYALRDRIAWETAASYSVFVARRLQGAELIRVRRTDDGLEVCDPGTPSCYAQAWDERRVAGSASLSYRIGERYKQTFTITAGASTRSVDVNAETEVPDGERDAARAAVLPRVRTEVFPKLGYGLWLPTYVVLQNLGTFGQSENVRVGPVLSASVAFPIEAFGSSSDSVVFSGRTGYVWSEHDALAEGSVGASSRYEDGRPRDQSVDAIVRGASPRLVLGRLVGLVRFEGARRDSARTLVTLGGDNGLRGFPADAFFALGGSRAYGNFEYRTLPLEIASVHLGAVAFYDAGTVYGSASDARLHHAVGTGLRVLFPQLNRTPFRLDLGFPLEGGFALGVSYGSEQAVPLTANDDAGVAGGVRAR